MAIPIDEALRQIREAWPSNAACLDDLQERLTGAHLIPLVPFAGAGLSIPLSFRAWGAFLKNLAAECRKSGKVVALLAKGKYEEAAETVAQALESAIFHQAGHAHVR
jgi:hypothetical protein